MNDAEIINLKDSEKAAIIKRVLGSRDGKKFKRILEIHFDVHLPDAQVGLFDPNRTFYQSGIRVPFCLMDQILSGKWDTDQPDPMADDDEPSEPL